MTGLEEYAFASHMKNLNTKYENFAREILSIQTPGSFNILYATDVHYIRKYALYVPAYYKVKEMTEFSGYAGIDLFAVTGDLFDGNATLKRQYRDMYDLIQLIRQSKTTSVLLSKGNHDDCSWYAYQKELGVADCVSLDDWYNHVVNPIRVQYPITLDENNIAGGYYYIDYPLQKIRVINLNTSDFESIADENGKIIREYCCQWRFTLREKQLKWLANALKFDEPGWSVMIMSHAFLLDDGANEFPVINGDIAWEIIKAYKNGAKGKVVSNEKYAEVEVEYDFTDNKSNDILPYLYGHVHRDMVKKYDGITAIASESFINSISADGQTCYDFDDDSVKLVGGWDCIVIDKEKRTFKKRRFERDGADLDIEY